MYHSELHPSTNKMFTFSLHTMDSDNKPTETVPTDEKKQGKKRNYRKDKPWDDGTVNKWEIEVGMRV